MYFATLATTFSYAWLGWLLAFVGIEFTALYYDYKHRTTGNEGGTLSELVRRIIRGNRLFFGIFSLLYVVLAIHFLT